MRLIDADALIELWKGCTFNGDITPIIANAPTIAPARKTGKWIDGKRMKFDGTFYWFRQCDQCGYERNDCDTEKDSNFCPDCGADMREVQDGKR